MAEKMVALKSMVNAIVAIKKPEYSFNRRWLKRGQVQAVPFSVLEQLLWDNSVRRMLEAGILYIEDLEVKKELGLEPYDATKPVNIIVLNEQEMINLLTKTPIDEFKRVVSRLPSVQVDNLIDYAVEKEILDSQKSSFLKKMTGKDILKTITRRRDVEEAERREEERLKKERDGAYQGRR